METGNRSIRFGKVIFYFYWPWYISWGSGCLSIHPSIHPHFLCILRMMVYLNPVKTADTVRRQQHTGQNKSPCGTAWYRWTNNEICFLTCCFKDQSELHSTLVSIWSLRKKKPRGKKKNGTFFPPDLPWKRFLPFLSKCEVACGCYLSECCSSQAPNLDCQLQNQQKCRLYISKHTER